VKAPLHGHTTLPTKTRKAERDKLTTEKAALNREYVSLKNEATEVEKIWHSVCKRYRRLKDVRSD